MQSPGRALLASALGSRPPAETKNDADNGRSPARKKKKTDAAPEGGDMAPPPPPVEAAPADEQMEVAGARAEEAEDPELADEEPSLIMEQVPDLGGGGAVDEAKQASAEEDDAEEEDAEEPMCRFCFGGAGGVGEQTGWGGSGQCMGVACCRVAPRCSAKAAVALPLQLMPRSPPAMMQRTGR